MCAPGIKSTVEPSAANEDCLAEGHAKTEEKSYGERCALGIASEEVGHLNMGFRQRPSSYR